MDKLAEHAIRMLEIVEGENDFYRNDAKRQADIARAVYDIILRVQTLERKSDRKTENCSEKPNNSTGYNLSPVEDETLTCDGNCWMKKQNGEWLCEHCQREPKTEQTERSSG